jgi:hypothetical protein
VIATDTMRGQLLAARKAPAAPWKPPAPADFRPWVPVLAYDATLTHTGWALIEAHEAGVRVRARGIINPETDLTGYAGTWEKARQLRDAIRNLHFQLSPDARRVVEAPSVGGGSRTESSLIAGLLVTMESPGGAVAVSATHVSAVLLGDARIRSTERKKAIRAYLAALIPETAGRNWNEHQRDAVATGLTHLYDLRAGYRQRGASS